MVWVLGEVGLRQLEVLMNPMSRGRLDLRVADVHRLAGFQSTGRLGDHWMTISGGKQRSGSHLLLAQGCFAPQSGAG